MFSRKKIVQRSASPHRPPPRGGFTLVELLIALLVFVEVVLAILILFDSTNRLTRNQTFMAELQQSQRVAQQQLVSIVRMAGRGGLPPYVALDLKGPFDGVPDTAVPRGLMITNNHPGGEMVSGDPKTEVLAGTDVVTVRGILRYPYYTVFAGRLTHFLINDSNLSDLVATIEVFEEQFPGVPMGNDIEDLRTLRDDNIPAPLLVVHNEKDNVYGLLEFSPAQSALDVGSGQPAVVACRINGGAHSAAYLGLSSFNMDTSSGSLETNLDGVGTMGIVEEYRFYIRPVPENPVDAQSRVAYRLAVARFLPGTNTLIDVQDIADNIIDLQVALGVDLNRDTGVTDTGDAADEWLYNAVGDDPDYVDADNTTILGREPLLFVRVSTVALTDRPQPGYVAPMLTQVEDHVYGSASVFNQRPEDRYRRSVRTDFIDLR